LAKAKSPDSRLGFVHTLAHDGSLLDPLRDTYDHAFVLLALSSVYALDRDAQVRAEIDAHSSFQVIRAGLGELGGKVLTILRPFDLICVTNGLPSSTC
jgi:N-acylglucosamine 2-epimerase (GlcNAc 2-epimerase)